MGPLLWLLIPLLLMNSYHGLMYILAPKRSTYRATISESAFQNLSTLNTYRIFHLASDISFLVFAYILATNYGLLLAAVLLTLAAMFDALQIVTLSKQTNHTPLYMRDRHQLYAWLMTIAYFLFAISLLVSQVNIPVIILFILFLVAVFVWSHTLRHRYFWFAQMIVFVSISLVMVVAAWSLLS